MQSLDVATNKFHLGHLLTERDWTLCVQYHTRANRIISDGPRSKAGRRPSRFTLSAQVALAAQAHLAAVLCRRGDRAADGRQDLRGLRCRARGAISTSPIAKLLTQFPATLIRQGLKIPESLS